MRRALFLLAAMLLLSTSAFANTKITIHNIDVAGKGFNDATPVVPVGGNPGTTLGEQRLNAFQKAADIWAGIINSDIEIIIDATFTDLTCDASSAVLGSAGPLKFLMNFPNAPNANVWYPLALANALAHTDLRPAGVSDIKANFNAKLDSGGCLGGTRFYYGFDGNHGNNVDLLPVLLHEFGHGLGFVGTESLATGNLFNNAPSVFARHVFDDTTGLRWDQMTAAQRLASVTDTAHLVWDGPSTRDAASKLLNQVVTMTVNSPAAVARNYDIGRANFGADPATSGLTGRLVAPQHIARLRRVTADACTPIANASEVAGNIALVDRGNCTYTVKAVNAQAAGATGMVVVDNTLSTCIPPGMSGIDTTIHIPVISISRPDGQALEAQLANGVNVTFHVDASHLAGADATGLVRLYSPCAYKAGSSVFHWDVAATPNLLMEPIISSDLSHGVDLTANQLIDIGWTTNAQ